MKRSGGSHIVITVAVITVAVTHRVQRKQLACYAINRLTTDVCTTVTTGNIAEPL